MRLLALVHYSLRRDRAVLAGFAALLLLVQALAARVAATFDETGTLGRLLDLVPPYIRSVMGSSLLSMLSFSGLALLGYFHVAITGALVGVVITLGTEVASETERGFSDLLMARPIRRGDLVTRSVIVLLLSATLVNGAMLAGTWGGLALFAGARGPWPTPRLLLSLSANLWALLVCWGGIALALGACARRRSSAGALAGFAALTLFLLDVVGRLWEPARSLRVVSPFRYFKPVEMVGGQPLAWVHVAVLCGIGALGITIAYLVYARRDL